MATEKKTPGVYIAEENAFPNSVVEVPTGTPAFVGYTETAQRGATPLAGVPTRITSFVEYRQIFGGAPLEIFRRRQGGDGFEPAQPRFHLYNAMRLFFDNGGGSCWIVSIGGYHAGGPRVQDYSDTVWQALAQTRDPSIYVAPDAVSLDWNGYKTVTERMMRDCGQLRDRVALLDLQGGAGPDLKGAIERFRSGIDLGDAPSYGVLYAPWLNTNLDELSDISFLNLDGDSRAALAAVVRSELPRSGDSAMNTAVGDLADKLEDAATDPAEAPRKHSALMAVSQQYQQAMQQLLQAINVMPPAGAMAGVWAMTDNTYGVFKAPANTGIVSVVSPTVAISDAEQEDMNAPIDGKAVNAIRAFTGRGVLVWGARTLDGNSQDFRYINVRRTLIMLEQSMLYATQAYVFEPNDSGTWVAVKYMLENFLTNQWKVGALAGASAVEAFSVDVGLGSTMTANDILDGYMRVTVRVALVRPAEFIVITFQQKMQSS